MKQLATLLKSMPGIKSIELKDVKRLTDLLREAPEIGSIEVQGFFGTKVVITRTALAPAAAPTPVFHAQAPSHHSPAPPCPGAGASALRPSRPRRPPWRSRKSGRRWWGRTTARRSRAPMPTCSSAPGSRSGQTVCIIEAMKIMNEIEAEVSGVIREVCVEDATPVEYGQVLYRVDPNG